MGLRKHIGLVFVLVVLFFTANAQKKESIFNQRKQLEVFKSTKNEISLKKKKDVMIYPNPIVMDKFIIKSIETVSSVEIINVIGQAVYKHKNKAERDQIEIVLENWKKGIYLVRLDFKHRSPVIRKILVK